MTGIQATRWLLSQRDNFIPQTRGQTAVNAPNADLAGEAI